MNTRKSAVALLAATTLVVAACSSNDYGDDDMPTPPAANVAPAVSAITDRSVDQDTAVGPIEFGISDRETPAGSLMVSAAADGNGLFPADGITLGGGGTLRSITLTPLEAATGTATITISVRDADGALATRSFAVQVNARAASFADTALATFAKGAAAESTPLNGFTFAQDADEATFAALIPPGEE
jgi:hypothetical protein